MFFIPAYGGGETKPIPHVILIPIRNITKEFLDIVENKSCKKA